MPKTKKTLFFDAKSLRLIGYLLTTKQFERYQVESGFYPLNKDTQLLNIDKISSDQVVFVIYPEKDEVDIIVQILFRLKMKKKFNFNIIFTSGETYEIIEYITSSNVIQYFNIYSFQTDLIPFDYDLLSLENDNVIKDLYINSKYDALTSLAKAIAKIELIYGKIKYKYIKGDNANVLNELLAKEEKNNGIEEPKKGGNEIYGCVFLDRNVDFITPFCSNYTYEGLLDETFGIDRNMIKVKEGIIDSTKIKDKDKLKTIEVSSRIVFYSRLRNMLFPIANSFLKTKLNELQSAGEQAKNMTVKSEISQLKNVLEKYKSMIVEEKGPMTEHISLAEYITKTQQVPTYKEYIQFEQLLLAGDLPQMLHEYYEKEMGKQNDIYKILRLMIIESLVQNGVENYSQIKKDATLIYGFQKIFLFKCLEQAGLLKEKPSSKIPFELNAYRSVQGKLNLINTEFNPNKINDCSYVFGGYCSISLRLIEAVVKNGWRDINDALKKLPGTTYYPSNEKEILRTTLAKKEKNFIFLVFIGGITYAEIEGIRFMNQINKDFKFIIITTSIVNPKKIFDSLEPEIPTSIKMKEAYEMHIAMKKKKK